MSSSSPSHGARLFVLFRIKGIDVAFTPSWLVTVTLLAVIVRMSSVIPEDAGKAAGAAIAVGITLLFYTFVLLHEAAHTVVASIFGLQPRRIVLFLLGGVSQIGRDPDEPKQEYLVALAGPVASLVIAAILAIVTRATNQPFDGVWGTLSVVNLFLALFNLIPGFPLDGGRVLRSTIWAVSGDRIRATRIAANGGRIVAAGLIAGGVMWLVLRFDDLSNGVWGVWYIVLGYFLNSHATDAGRMEVEREVIHEQARRDAMNAAAGTPEAAQAAGDIVPQPAATTKKKKSSTAGPRPLKPLKAKDRTPIARGNTKKTITTDIVPNGKTKPKRQTSGKQGRVASSPSAGTRRSPRKASGNESDTAKSKASRRGHRR